MSVARHRSDAQDREPEVAELRPMDARLGGYPWLPRMIDKARASRRGTLGDAIYPCPIDQSLLARLGIPPWTFADIAERATSDEDILAELERHGVATAAEAEFDPVALEESFERGDGPRYSVVAQAELPLSNIAREFVGEEQGSNMTFLLVDAPPGRGPAMHSHPYEEIIIIQAGQATFFLGEHAARIARAGEIVVIPAGQPHAFVNSGDEPLRQLDIHASPRFATEWL
jgi:quercetin dioxygenase-like cupin family protein